MFFRAQDELGDDLQKELGQRLGELAGKPKTSNLHIHPLISFGNESGAQDHNINIISTNKAKNPAEDIAKTYRTRKGGNLLGWHTDISYEPVPSDYTILRLTELPSSGGGMVLSLQDPDDRRLTRAICRHLVGFELRTL